MSRSKLFISRLFASIMIFAMILSACAQPAETTEAPKPTEAPKATEPQAAAPTEAPVATESVPEAPMDAWVDVDPKGQTVIYWNQFTGGTEKALNAIAEEFNASNEWGITVVPQYQGNYADVFNKMLTFLNTPEAPNLVVAYQNQAATYQLAEALVDMTSMVDSPKWGLTEEDQKDFFAGFFQQDIFPLFQNQRLGFPPNRSMEVLYYNQEWLKELGYDAPPATPEEFKEMACKATQQKFSKATADGPVGYELSMDASRFASWTFAFGGDVFDAQKETYTLNTEASQKAMAFLQDLYKSGCAITAGPNFQDQTDFGAGKALFTIGSTSGINFYQSAIDAGAQFQWSVAALPHTTPDPVMNVYGASVSIPKTTPEAELAAWLFVKYFTSPEVQAQWVTASNYFPVRASVADGLSEYFAKNPAYKAAFDLLQYAHFEPAVPGYDPVRVKIATAMVTITEQGEDVAATLDQVNIDGNDELAAQMAMVPESPDPLVRGKVDPSGQKVVFWHNHSKAREEALLKIVDDFNKSNKFGITVEAQYQGSYADIYNKMVPILGTADVPDLVVAYQNNAASYQIADALVDMNVYVNSYKWGLTALEKRDFFSGFFNQDVFPNFLNADKKPERLGFPPNRSMEVMYYNQDWLKELGYEAPPATPEEFKEMACKAATTPYSKATAEGPMGYQYDPGDASHLAAWVFAFGGDIYDAKKGQYTFTSEAAVKAATFIQDLFNSGCATVVEKANADQTDFGAGTLLFTTSSSSGLPFYKSAVEAGANFAWNVGAVPHTTKDPVQNVYGASVSMPKTTEERQLATWLFVKYFTSAEVQAEWSVASNYFPVRASVANGLTDYFTTNTAYKTAFDMLKFSKFEPPVPGYDPVRVEMSNAMAAIINGEDVMTALEALNTTANEILAENLAQIK